MIIGLSSNIFGIFHTIYTGSIKAKALRLVSVLQNFAVIIKTFSQALNITEHYLINIKKMLDFIDYNILIMEHKKYPFIHKIIENQKKKKQKY